MHSSDWTSPAVAIGLESSNEEVLRKCVRKGFTVKEYRRAAEALNAAGIPLRTYLLLKPPFLTERSVQDTISSIAFSSPFSESVSINPVNVQILCSSRCFEGATIAPWLWSLVEVLRRGRKYPDAALCPLLQAEDLLGGA